ncbi:MAG TPA: hypothetical protein VFQ30_05180 [Ktedonobacteraceae bacterium]|nr:hypothetical protein [Ktedonobacteraceae bacterium]
MGIPRLQPWEDVNADADIPDMGGTTAMNGRGNSGQMSFALWSQVVGVDLQPEGGLPLHVNIQRCTERGHGLRQHDGDAAM